MKAKSEYRETVVITSECDGLATDSDGVFSEFNMRPRFPYDYVPFSVDCISRGNLRAPVTYFSLWLTKLGSRKKISSPLLSGYHAMAKIAKMRESDYELAGKRFFEGRVNKGYINLLDTFIEAGKPVVVCSRNPAVKYILKSPHITDIVSNNIIFSENGVYDHVEIKLKDGNDKMTKLDEYLKEKCNSSLDRFAYLGDADQDIPPGKNAKIFLASPYANGNCRKEARQIYNYGSFARDLKKEMPKLSPLQI